MGQKSVISLKNVYFCYFCLCCCCSADTISSGRVLEDEDGDEIMSSGKSGDRISSGQVMKDGSLIISPGKIFALGFFSPENSSDLRYVGIWYTGIPQQTVVWVANRENPIRGRAGTLSISKQGNLVVRNRNGDPLWSTNASSVARNSSAILTDSGNLYLISTHHRGKTNRPLWQSFDFPTDTFLPGMKVSFNATSQLNPVIIPWRTESDPSLGNYSMGVDPRGSPQIVVWEGQSRHWRSGHWNGLIFMGVPWIRVIYLYGFKLVNDGNGRLHFTYTLSSSSQLTYFRIFPNGTVEQKNWSSDLQQWEVIQLQPSSQCDIYNKCGPFGVCDARNSPVCNCLEGYVPKDVDQWNNGNWSSGCVRRTKLQCEVEGSYQRDGFLKVETLKLPDFLDHVGTENVKECGRKCLNNCSCVAYSFVSGINCMIWSNDLVDIQRFEEGGSPLFVRLAQSEIGGSTRKTPQLVIIIATVVAGLLLAGVFIWLLWRQKDKLRGISESPNRKGRVPDSDPIKSGELSADFSGPDDLNVEGQQGSGTELALFSFSSVVAATNNFSDRNKLGQGGFGLVYKGELPGGQNIAVKRLSGKSGQGLEEFKTEITLIAKLQHRNLVRLLGCCIDGDEKLLLYEYMPNKSLDSFLFDPVKQKQLGWRTRFRIIEGIARGLLYLHRDSRLRIIHRDLKASNILLDEEMNPKISDFGMARIFGGNQNEASTNRVVGTYGYMAPEYAMEGLFSVKTDVYSFGILLLEIVTGRRNIGFRSTDNSSVIGYVRSLSLIFQE
ncbi:OLC1v1021801C2 [Oldenlandia corymbosa var. corymbosa]|uniref:Receptor-like serine/threonine-protein kinase n=1 Tax=Oldenlandia corymbosa var. corymbosa TaxID=529605 RepID=A0AAV1BZ25_OLDCO|nr:OLC1v1021801C2 [Oldenlandia corymbosa var. corymbosa]